MLKTFKYRIYPTKKQTTTLLQTLEECRWLYNHFLEERKSSYEREKKSMSYHSQAVSMVKLKQDRPSLTTVHSQVLQNVAVRIDLAFKAFFRRLKAHETPGYPRFKGKGYDSFTFPQSGFRITENGLKLSKIGLIKIILHRPIEGKIKTCTIRKSATNKWFVTFSCLVNPKPLRKSKRSTGIDVGIESFATFSNKAKIENPHFLKQEENILAKAQRKFSKTDKATPKRKKLSKIISRIHERISNKRTDFSHQQSRKIINQYGTICVEDLSINKMIHDSCLSKNISDVAWGQFIRYLSYKAESAGRNLIKVNPAYTSQDCSKCGHRETKKLSDRIHTCSCCGFTTDRDHNAALNILALGLQSMGSIPRSSQL